MTGETLAVVVLGVAVLAMAWALARTNAQVCALLRGREALLMLWSDKALAADENQRSLAYARMNAEAEAAKNRPVNERPREGDMGEQVVHFPGSGGSGTIG